MGFLDWAALIIGGGLTVSGLRAIVRRRAHIPEPFEGGKAVALGCIWIGLGAIFLLAVAFDIAPLKAFFKLFLEAAN